MNWEQPDDWAYAIRCPVHTASLAISFVGYKRYLFVVMETEASEPMGWKGNHVG